MDTKTKMLSNKFIDKVRNGFVVDEGEFNELCKLLETLIVEWKNKKEVDKELVQHLYILPYVTKNMAEALRKNRRSEADDKLADTIDEKSNRLDDLVLQCLNS